jgi:anti-sigma regulatory factor (Ser/Thr protein kinase)
MNIFEASHQGGDMRPTTRSAAARPARDLSIELPVTPESPRRSRHAARDWCDECGLSQEARDIILLLLSEVVTNSVKHSPAAESPIEVDASFVGNTVQVVVSDGGQGFAPQPREPSSSGGYGLFLLDAQATRWGTSRDRPTRVWFELDIG